MEKVLDQSEIDAMVRAARGIGKRGPHDNRSVTPWDIRQSGQIGREHLHSISVLHEEFAKNLTHALGAYLRIDFAAALVSAEHLTYGEFLQRVPELTYLASCSLLPVGVSALLQLDMAVAFPLIDILLGGEGKAASVPQRAITEIEEQILETIVRIICREWQSAWQALALEFHFEERRQAEQIEHLLPREEKTLTLSFEITVAESRGTLNLVVPVVVSNALLRKISSTYARDCGKGNAESAARLRARLLQCPFHVDLDVELRSISMRDLSQLAPGHLLVTDQPLSHPGQLRAGDQAIFLAAVVRRGRDRAAQILRRALRPEDAQSGEYVHG